MKRRFSFDLSLSFFFQNVIFVCFIYVLSLQKSFLHPSEQALHFPVSFSHVAWWRQFPLHLFMQFGPKVPGGQAWNLKYTYTVSWYSFYYKRNICTCIMHSLYSLHHIKSCLCKQHFFNGNNSTILKIH